MELAAELRPLLCLQHFSLGGKVAKGERGRREQCLGQLADTLRRGELTRHGKAACWVSG